MSRPSLRGVRRVDKTHRRPVLPAPIPGVVHQQPQLPSRLHPVNQLLDRQLLHRTHGRLRRRHILHLQPAGAHQPAQEQSLPPDLPLLPHLPRLLPRPEPIVPHPQRQPDRAELLPAPPRPDHHLRESGPGHRRPLSQPADHHRRRVLHAKNHRPAAGGVYRAR